MILRYFEKVTDETIGNCAIKLLMICNKLLMRLVNLKKMLVMRLTSFEKNYTKQTPITLEVFKITPKNVHYWNHLFYYFLLCEFLKIWWTSLLN